MNVECESCLNEPLGVNRGWSGRMFKLVPHELRSGDVYTPTRVTRMKRGEDERTTLRVRITIHYVRVVHAVWMTDGEHVRMKDAAWMVVGKHVRFIHVVYINGTWATCACHSSCMNGRGGINSCDPYRVDGKWKSCTLDSSRMDGRWGACRYHSCCVNWRGETLTCDSSPMNRRWGAWRFDPCCVDGNWETFICDLYYTNRMQHVLSTVCLVNCHAGICAFHVVSNEA